MKLNTDILDPAIAVSIARRELAKYDITHKDSLAGYFPSQEIPDIEYTIEQEMSDRVTAANWRMFDGQATSEVFGAGGSARGAMMPLSRRYTLDEHARIRQRNNANHLKELEAEKLVRRGARSIFLAVNLQRANALYNGKIEINGSGGLRMEVDFGRDPSFTTTANHLLTDPNSDIITELKDLASAYEDKNGFAPETMLMNRKILDRIGRLESVRKALVVNPDRRDFVVISRQAISDYLTIECDLPTPVITSEAKVRVDVLDSEPGGAKAGEQKDVYLHPQDSITFAPKPGEPTAVDESVYGKTFWGQTVSFDSPDFRGVTDAFHDNAGMVAAVVRDGWPVQEDVIIDALTMPVTFNPDYTMKVKVL